MKQLLFALGILVLACADLSAQDGTFRVRKVAAEPSPEPADWFPPLFQDFEEQIRDRNLNGRFVLPNKQPGLYSAFTRESDAGEPIKEGAGFSRMFGHGFRIFRRSERVNRHYLYFDGDSTVWSFESDRRIRKVNRWCQRKPWKLGVHRGVWKKLDEDNFRAEFENDALMPTKSAYLSQEMNSEPDSLLSEQKKRRMLSEKITPYVGESSNVSPRLQLGGMMGSYVMYILETNETGLTFDADTRYYQRYFGKTYWNSRNLIQREF